MWEFGEVEHLDDGDAERVGVVAEIVTRDRRHSDGVIRFFFTFIPIFLFHVSHERKLVD